VLSKTDPAFHNGSGRLELADRIFSDAAPLAARVIVNRIWAWHFGKPLVATPSDFGAQGEKPTHPELLDDLAARFIANHWSLKWLHREIMLSATYQQASRQRPEAVKLDPGNRLIWRMSRAAWTSRPIAIASCKRPAATVTPSRRTPNMSAMSSCVITNSSVFNRS